MRRSVCGGCALHNKPSYPAKAGIQYAAAYRFHHNGSGILDHPPSRMMTAGCGADSYVNHSFTIPRHDMPGLCVNVSPHEKSGRGECRVPVAPAVARVEVVARALVTTVAPGSPGIPARDGVTVSFALSQVIGLVCHLHWRNFFHQLNANH